VGLPAASQIGLESSIEAAHLHSRNLEFIEPSSVKEGSDVPTPSIARTIAATPLLLSSQMTLVIGISLVALGSLAAIGAEFDISSHPSLTALPHYSTWIFCHRDTITSGISRSESKCRHPLFVLPHASVLLAATGTVVALILKLHLIL